MRPTRAELLAAVESEPLGIRTRDLANKLHTVPYQITATLSKFAAYGVIRKTVMNARGDALWRPL
jgi:hypothetical protein